MIKIITKKCKLFIGVLVVCFFAESPLRSNAFRNWFMFRLARDYYPCRLHKTCDLDPNRKYICGYHPHGVMPNGGFITLTSNACNIDKVIES